MKTQRSRQFPGLQALKGLIPRAALKLSSLEATCERSAEIFHLNHSIQNSVAELVRHAKDDDQFAALTLAHITLNAVAQLTEIAERRPKMLWPLSSKTFAWPALVSHKREIAQRNRELLNLLKVGQKGRYTTRKWQFSAPTTSTAMNVLDLAQEIHRAGKLPRLTKNTKRKWFDAAWKRALWAGWTPENDLRLSGIAKSKATKKPKYCKTLHPATSRSNLRAAIKAQVWIAFDKLVRA